MELLVRGLFCSLGNLVGNGSLVLELRDPVPRLGDRCGRWDGFGGFCCDCFSGSVVWSLG